MSNNLNIVIPMKSPVRSKQRLMSVLTLAQRETLATTLFRKTLAFFAEHYSQVNRLVVTDSDQIARIAKIYGAQVLIEQQSKGLNSALESATNWSVANGFDQQMVIPADIAHLEIEEIEPILEAAKNNAVVIARAKDNGTNALLTTPPNAIEFCYGNQSSLAHVQEAHKKKLTVEILNLANLSQDIDVPDDLFLVSPSYQAELSAKGVLL